MAAAALIRDIPETIKSNIQSMTIKKCVQTLFHCWFLCSILLTMAHLLCFVRTSFRYSFFLEPKPSLAVAHWYLHALFASLLFRRGTWRRDPPSIYPCWKNSPLLGPFALITWIPLLWSTPGQLSSRSQLMSPHCLCASFRVSETFHVLCEPDAQSYSYLCPNSSLCVLFLFLLQFLFSPYKHPQKSTKIDPITTTYFYMKPYT